MARIKGGMNAKKKQDSLYLLLFGFIKASTVPTPVQIKPLTLCAKTTQFL